MEDNRKTFYDLQVKNLVKKFDNKTQNNLSTSKRILIDGKDMYYLEFINSIFNNDFKGDNKINRSKIMYVGYTSDYLINLFKDLEVDLNGFILAFDSDYVSHAINHHVNVEEMNRGQIKLTISDFKNWPSILSNVISVELKDENKLRQQTYCVICKNKKYDFYIFEAVSSEKKILLFNTMWKK